MPEAEQGLNMARLISLMGLDIEDVPGVTVNRYCASGLETIGIATAKIQSGMADCIIAGGAESMSYIPMGGYKPTPDYDWPKKATKITIGEWGLQQKRLRNSSRFLVRTKMNSPSIHI